ncbi:Hypothetical protein A7982_03392 [Minicystis rosea]|nr:Hypothetical protein A7982_03392 [Minicystis rosea]
MDCPDGARVAQTRIESSTSCAQHASMRRREEVSSSSNRACGFPPHGWLGHVA